MCAQSSIVGFNAGIRAEKIKGNPRSVRLETQDLQSGTRVDARGAVYLQETSNWLPGGKVMERSVYRLDGTLSYRFVYEYDGNSWLTTVKTFDGTARHVQTTHNVRVSATETEEVVMNADGKEQTRTITILDEAGRPVESTHTDLSDNSQVHEICRYDAQGRPAGGEVTFKGMPAGFPSRVQTARQADGSFVTRSYAPDGSILMETSTSEEGVVREFSQVTSHEANPRSRQNTIERIDAIDAEGNWTEKTVFEHHTEQSQPNTPVAQIRRTITYYSH